jgi:replication factor A1
LKGTSASKALTKPVQKEARGCGERLTQWRMKNLDIKDLRNGMKRVTVEASVVEKGEPREVRSRYKDETYTVADAVVADETGSIKLTLWNEQIDQVNVGNKVKIENGYVTSFKGEIQLNVGKFGTMTVE